MSSLSSHLSHNKSADLAHQLLEIIPRTMREIRSNTQCYRGKKLPLPQFRVLGNVWRESKTNKQLAEDIGLSISAMSRVISSMENNGWIKKVENAEDRRYSDIFITTEGLHLFNDIWTYTSQMISEKIDRLSEREKKELQNGLKIVEELFTCSHLRN